MWDPHPPNPCSGKEVKAILKETCDKACAILQKTNDGDELDPRHLKLLEMAVNGFLNDKGEVAFEELYTNVQAGYKKPWFHDIEHLIRNHAGYVLWKGKVVEHYDSPWAYTNEAKKQAEEVASRCRILESRGETPTTHNVISAWPD